MGYLKNVEEQLTYRSNKSQRSARCVMRVLLNEFV